LTRIGQVGIFRAVCRHRRRTATAPPLISENQPGCASIGAVRIFDGNDSRAMSTFGGTKAIFAAAGNLRIAVTKFIAYLLSGSSAARVPYVEPDMFDAERSAEAASGGGPGVTTKPVPDSAH